MKETILILIVLSISICCTNKQNYSSSSQSTLKHEKDSSEILQDSIKRIINEKISIKPKSLIDYEIVGLYQELLTLRDFSDSTKINTFNFKIIDEIVHKIAKDGLLEIDTTELIIKAYGINATYWMSSIRMEGEPENSIVIETDEKLVLNSEVVKGNYKTLNSVQRDKLLSMIKLPSNFEWGFCGSFIPKGGFVFEKKGEIIFALDIRCGAQLVSHPEDFRIKSGALINTDELLQILEELNIDII